MNHDHNVKGSEGDGGKSALNAPLTLAALGNVLEKWMNHRVGGKGLCATENTQSDTAPISMFDEGKFFDLVREYDAGKVVIVFSNLPKKVECAMDGVVVAVSPKSKEGRELPHFPKSEDYHFI